MTIWFNSHSNGWSWLSNFALCSVLYDARMYPSVEHAYQAAKTVDQDMRDQVWRCATPQAAKRMGKQLELRPDWEDVKLHIMRMLLERKFLNDRDMRGRLLATGSEQLLHLAPWDMFWGVNYMGTGRNELGRMIMDTRALIRTMH